MIKGIGTDLVDIARFARLCKEKPQALSRLFAPEEGASGLRPESLAARFAAKEAVFKALGGRYGARWAEIAVTGGGADPPRLLLSGAAAARARDCGISRWHVSLSHEGGMAQAFVIGEGDM